MPCSFEVMHVFRRSLGFVLAAAFLAAGVSVGGTPAGDRSPAVRITSPLGRTGLPGAIRIVAQVKPAGGRKIVLVRFSVDGTLLATVDGEPPYAVDWADSNPFDRKEIVVEAEDDEGDVGRDAVVLEPLQVTELAEVTSVLVEAGIYDSKGRMVRGLTAPEFVLEEDGVAQTPDMVAQETIPTTFALLVDASQSMWRNLEFVRDAASRLTAYLRPKDRVIVAPFSKGIGAVTGPTADKATVAEAIDAIAARGGTAMRDALIAVSRRFDGVEGRRVIVLITDAYDEHSTSSLVEAVDSVRESGITVYAVGIGGVAGISMKGHDELKAIAAGTGGRAFFPPRPAALGDVYDVLASDAQLRYLITYTPTNQRRDGTWRRIALRTHARDVVVKARDGYYAPKPPPVKPTIEFTAVDLENRFLEVTKDDLVILEDGVEQSVETFHEATTPVTLVMALDSSGSMKPVAGRVVEAGAAFVGALRPEDSLGMISFANRSLVAHGVTTERELTLRELSQYRTEGGTALYDALCDSLLMLKQYTGRRALVVLTDGRDENNPGTAPGSLRTFDDVVQLLHSVEATVFPVGLGTKIDPERLERLASISGGQAYFPENVMELDAQFARIIENLRHRYIVGYTSTNPRRDGGWRKVEVRTRTSGILVSSRNGYFAPER